MTSYTLRVPDSGPPARDPSGDDLRWLSLLDELHAAVESEGLGVVTGTLTSWPEHWRPVLDNWATRIGARSVQITTRRTLQSPCREAGFVSRRRITAALHEGLSQGRTISAESMSPDGFTADQEHEFHAFCSHLNVALALRASLEAARTSLSALYRVMDSLPLGIVVLDERLDVVLLNCQSRDWLARTQRAALQAQRLCLSAHQAAFDCALRAFVSDPLASHHHLNLNGLDIELKKLAGAPVCVLLLIEERCDSTHQRDIATPPALLARQMQRQYALTDKELPLAWNVAQGMPLKQYAGLSGRSIETVRAQLKSVFRKLGASDQKSIGMVLFETLHAATLQSVGECLATAAADTATPPEHVHPLPWR